MHDASSSMVERKNYGSPTEERTKAAPEICLVKELQGMVSEMEDKEPAAREWKAVEEQKRSADVTADREKANLVEETEKVMEQKTNFGPKHDFFGGVKDESEYDFWIKEMMRC
mmetsp:Transcript_11636/g.15376  ORF Transcript_11636/g.15376 Transcript_11636/m.15376 type:complete len:113 (-) Transcript_11636:352-690(-)